MIQPMRVTCPVCGRPGNCCRIVDHQREEIMSLRAEVDILRERLERAHDGHDCVSGQAYLAWASAQIPHTDPGDAAS